MVRVGVRMSSSVAKWVDFADGATFVIGLTALPDSGGGAGASSYNVLFVVAVSQG